MIEVLRIFQLSLWNFRALSLLYSETFQVKDFWDSGVGCRVIFYLDSHRNSSGAETC